MKSCTPLFTQPHVQNLYYFFLLLYTNDDKHDFCAHTMNVKEVKNNFERQ